MTIIVGSGMAGLLAGNMLRQTRICEAQPSLPNNHSAVLRFRSSTVGDILGIPFKKVTMIKGHEPWRNPIADALAYSMKVTGIARSDRSIINGTTVAERFIAPPDLIARMANGLDITFGYRFTFDPESISDKSGNPIISTLPMPALMKALNYPLYEELREDFRWSPGINIRGKIRNCDAYVSLYVPDPEVDFSRISITGDELIVEMPVFEWYDELFDRCQARADRIGAQALERLGISGRDLLEATAHKQTYAKVLPVDDSIRKTFLHWATDKHNVYSLGRFATWRPGLQLDDLVNDIRLIDKWIRGDKYGVRAHR